MTVDLSIFNCCILGRTADVADLLDNGGAVDCTDSRGRTPLMVACWAGRLEVVQLLLQRGADVNARNLTGTTAFMYAKSAALGSGSPAIMQCLVDRNADVEARDNHGKTALEYARDNFELVEIFILGQGSK